MGSVVTSFVLLLYPIFFRKVCDFMVDIALAEVQEFLNAMPYFCFILLLMSIIGSIVFKKV